MISITKTFEFCYGHHLPDHEGKCRNNHGHNATLEIEVSGAFPKSGPSKGMILDFGKLKEIVYQKVILELDHQDLNSLKLFDPPTAENIVEWIVKTLEWEFGRDQIDLLRVRCYETPSSYAEWRKE